MEVTSTIEINGEEREIADAYAREQCAANADGITNLNNNLSVIGKCKNLLNPTLQTTTKNGVTCTENGDGTYTLTGTATADTNFSFMSKENCIPLSFDKYKILGMSSFEKLSFDISFYDSSYNEIKTVYVYGNPTVSNSDGYYIMIGIHVKSGKEYNGEIIKPMVTTNLDATYDDFVPYTGDGDTLTADVAELKNDLSVKKFELVAGALWLCVSGKHCVLTLNGYNLTEPTHFDKLEEYQPYLVARNVVSNGDSVCIAAVEPNGNINASDLVVGTSLTGQLFGEVSWIANI